MGSSKKQTVGYRYYLGEHMILCHGPIDYVSQIKVDDRVAWAGLAEGGNISINATGLFGGDDREGGISGVVSIQMGYPDQLQDAYLQAKVDPDVPAYRGVVGAVLYQCYLGTNPYLKPWAFRGTRVGVRQDGEPQWYQAKAGIPHDLEGSAAFYFLLDRSNSLSGSEFLAIKNAAKAGLDLILDYITKNPTQRVDVAVRFYSAGSTALELTNVDAADIASLKTFIDGVTQVTGGDVNAAMAFIKSWFNTSIAVDFAKRAVIFVTDSNTEDEMTTAASPGGNAYEMINHLSPFSYPKLVDIYAINYNTSVTTWTGLIDNTPMDGVPIIAGSDDEGLTNAVLAALGSRFIDMNPVHIIRECLTDPNWGMGYAEGDVDDVTFKAAADTLFTERLGMSLLWDRAMQLSDFIQEVAKHIDCALYVSQTTGKFEIKLIRDDYDEGSLILLDESNIVRITDPSQPTFGELSNSVTVTFYDEKNAKDATVTVTDPAMVQMQGQVIGSPLQYPGFTTRRNATIAAQRDLRTLSSPYLACTIYTHSDDAADLKPGGVFKFTWPRWKVDNMIMRVTEMAFGNGKSNQIRITCTQDIFKTSLTTVISDPGAGWVDPSQPPTAVVQQMATEVPYYELVQTLGQTTVDGKLTTNNELGYVVAAASQPTFGINARIWTNPGPGYDDVGGLDFCPYASLGTGINQMDTVIAITADQDLDNIEVGTFVQIGEDTDEMEICRVDEVDILLGEVTLGRGCLDTTPKIHAVGTKLFFWDLYRGFDPTEYVLGETVDVKITPVSGQGQVEVSAALPMTVELQQRAFRPYPPGQLKINGDYYPAGPFGTTLTITWAHRDRVQQTSGTIEDHTTGNIGPEAGTTYRVRGYIDGVLIHTEEPATSGTTWDPGADGMVTIAVDSKRDGVYSWQAASHEFVYTGSDILLVEDGEEYLATEAGEIRITED